MTSLNSAFLDGPDDEEHNVDVRDARFLALTYEFFKFNKNFREAILDEFFLLINLTLQMYKTAETNTELQLTCYTQIKDVLACSSMSNSNFGVSHFSQ